MNFVFFQSNKQWTSFYVFIYLQQPAGFQPVSCWKKILTCICEAHMWCSGVMQLWVVHKGSQVAFSPFRLKQQFTGKEAGTKLKIFTFAEFWGKKTGWRVDCLRSPTNNPEQPYIMDEPSIRVQKKSFHRWTLEQSAFINSGGVITWETGGSE